MNIIKIVLVVIALIFITWLALFVGQKINNRIKQNPPIIKITQNSKLSPTPTLVPTSTLIPTISFPSPTPSLPLGASPTLTLRTSPTPSVTKGGVTPVTGPEMFIPLAAIVTSAAAGLYLLKK